MPSNSQQSLIHLSKQPLHGVTLCINGENSFPDMPYQLDLTFDSLLSTTHAEPIWRLTDTGERYVSDIKLSRNKDKYELNIDCEGKGAFTLQGNQLNIDWQTDGTGAAHYLQTLGLSLFLELNGKLCLHANTLVKNNKANLFLAPSRTGKSTLTTMLSAKGYALTTDDMVALYAKDNTYSVYPSWPKVRLWPDSAAWLKQYLAQQPIAQQKVHQRFAKQEITFQPQHTGNATNVAGMYYLNRVEHLCGSKSLIQVTQIKPSAALIMLMQNSMLGNAYRGLGIEQSRMAEIAKLLKCVPFYQISYVSGLAKLPDIATLIDELLSP